MEFIDYFAAYWLIIKYLVLFAALIILLSSIDDFFIDCYYWIRRIWRKFTVYRKHKPFNVNELYKNTEKPIAIMVPAWHEKGVIADMAALAASSFEYYNYHIFIGTYPNDPETQHDVDIVAEHYRNIHKVVTRTPGPTNKSDCLNNIIEHIFIFEKSHNITFDIFVLHDAEDVIHPLELKLFNHLIAHNDLIQIPVFPFQRKWYDLTAGHYEDEFAENHGKDLIVRESILGFVPSAGVGTALSRKAIERLREIHEGEVFSVDTLTEDYSLGYELFKEKMKLIFVRVPAEIEYRANNRYGQAVPGKKQELITVREFFPSTFRKAVNQKSRWLTGIALQGWQKIGWTDSFKTNYILFRDRKAILTNLANILAYILVVNVLFMTLYSKLTTDTWWFPPIVKEDTLLWTLLIINAFFLLNRVLQRMYFTYKVYGIKGALLSFPRIVWGNIINFFAMFKAIRQFFKNKKEGSILTWDKTTHDFPINIKFHTMLGDILIEKNLIDQTTLNEALELQKSVNKPLGQLLVEQDILSEEELTKAMALQGNLEYIDITIDQIDRSLIKEMDRYAMLEHDILILKEKEGLQPIVSSHQLVDVIIDDYKKIISKDTKLFIANESTIQTIQKEILFPDLTENEYLHLRTVVKQKMIPRNMVSQILAYRAEHNITFIASCQHFGFLPEDQLKRIGL
ncbi:glycosyl transferase family protein [Sulfurovum sp. TSL1]|uniref:glycosyl transferase family protein n=1 Tax=Sulfurovum sp. TSL1 TaxID=2826994 RepID=UPI001CC4C293|nr:glycosyl transferase family protein [Sulfurovum sp. TSL1]GIT98385.1 bacteriophage N4 adsorption protein B [Sulfurovum sp. TSL1]